MSNLEYPPEEYARKLMKILNSPPKRKKNEFSSTFRKVDYVRLQDEPLPSRKLHKLQATERKSTPYPATSKPKLSSKTFKGQVLFNTSDDDNDFSKEDVSIETVEEYEENTWFPSSSNTYRRQSKNKQIIGDKVKDNSKSKSVAFSETYKSYNQSLKRQLTPYYPVNKKMKKDVHHDIKQVLFQTNDSESDSDEIKYRPIEQTEFDYSHNLESSSKNNDDVLSKKGCKKKMKKTKKVKCTNNDIDMNVTELICNSEKYKNALSSTDFFFSDEQSDSEYSHNSGEFSISNVDCTDSIIERDVSIDVNSETEENLQQTEHNILDETDIYEEEVKVESPIEANSIDFDYSNEEVGQADYFSLQDSLIIVLQNNSKLYFHGLMSVKVLFGVVEILGYTLTASYDSVEIFSPRGSSFLFFETKGGSGTSIVQNGLPDKLGNLGMEHETAKELSRSLQPGSAVVLCREINKTEISFMKKHISQQLFPKCEFRMPQCVFQNKIGTWDVLKPNAEWDVLVKSVKPFSKTLICGGKSVGKSTMLRYMINKLLSEYPRILVIDLDPGQPEFTLSGCVSAVIVTEPIFGPNYTHLRQPYRCVFVPDINISYQPDNYLNSVEQLILSCADFPKMPILINYMGFTRGFGLEIFSAVVAYAQPTNIIQIESSANSRNYKKQLNYKLILDTSRTLAPKTDPIPPFDIVTISSMADKNESWHLQPRQIREMSVLSYLSKILPKDVLSLTDTEVPVFIIDLSEIKLLCNGKTVSPAVVNGNLVAMCSLQSNNSYTCFGWGVVRGINLSTNELFLLTPVQSDELEQVDHLILGSVSLPPSLYMTSDNNAGLAPYISEGVLTSLGQIPKRSHLPPKPSST